MKTIKLNNLSVEVTKEQLEEALAEFDKPKFDYPLAFMQELSQEIVLFDSLTSGTVLKQGTNWYSNKKGEYSENWMPHTNNYWKPIPYDKERGFYHKQPVYCWNIDFSHQAVVRFYDAEKKRTFSYNGGTIISSSSDNYSATMPEHMLEFQEA